MSQSAIRAAVCAWLLGMSAWAFAAAPNVTTTAAGTITISSAVLNGTGVPGGETTTGWFRISATNPVTCDDAFGTRVPASTGTNLGSGVGAVNYSITTTGLVSGTTYYFCAIVENPTSKAFGTVLNFTVPGAPVTTTIGTTTLASTSATLKGSANPVVTSTTAYFRYGTTNPGVCDDTYGTRAPASGGTNAGTGNVAVEYTQAITGLTPGATYYYCAVALNAYGTTFGAVLSLTTPGGVPTANTGGVTLQTSTTATFNGSSSPTGAPTTAWFRYGTTSPGTCNDTFGTRAPSTGGSDVGSGNSSVAFTQAITGLSAGTTYYYCAIAQNSYGTTLGNLLTYVSPAPPTTVTVSSSSVGNTSAVFNGTSNPNRAATTGYFRYAATDPVTCNDTFGSRAPVTGGSNIGSGASAVAYAQSVNVLSAGTTYYFCAVSTNAEGMSFGAVLSFTTPAVPTAASAAATLITTNGATLNGSGDPNLSDANGVFRYSTANPGTCNSTFGTVTPSTYLGVGTDSVSYARAITGLTAATTYYFCAVVDNGYGTAYGAVLSFTTLSTLPTANTGSATLLTLGSGTLNGSSAPGGAPTTAWFRYSATSPGTCNDTFGTRAPATGGSDVGTGLSSVAFSQSLTGLVAGTTYYYCAIAQNVNGTVLGSLLSFVMPSPPTTVTVSSTSVGSTTAVFNGTSNANRAATTGYFRYAATDPVTCNDTFGSRAPVTGGSNIGSGASAVAYAQSVNVLSAGTTYYFCAVSTNAEGMSFGAVQSFTTAAPPTAASAAATLVTINSATLNGSGDPNLSDANGVFRYSTANPGTCNSTFGTVTPSTYLGVGTDSVSYARAITGLTAATTYYFCAVVDNGYGTAYGAVLSFTTLSTLPTANTGSATLLTLGSGTLNGSSAPGGAPTTAWFRYSATSPGTCNDTFGARAPATGGSDVGSGLSSVSFSQALTGLSAGTTYYYCAIAQNVNGPVLGSLLSFVMPSAPTVVTTSSSSVGNTSAVFNGTANANRAATTGYFRYAATDPVTCNDTFGSRAPVTGGSNIGSGASALAYAQSVNVLSAGTTYYFCAIATNSEGISFGAVQSFTTAAVPTAASAAATQITINSATLNGSGDPNLSDANGVFRYSTSNPGTCNSTFGTVTASTYLGVGTDSVSYARAITGLTAATTYYFCAVVDNGYGTAYGAVLSFTTLSTLPTANTGSATLLTLGSGTLNGSSAPGGAPTTAWFRYSATSPGTCNDTFGTRAPATGGSDVGSGLSSVSFSQALTGLSAGTTYYYCAIAQNVNGPVLGSLLSFVMPSAPTVVTTSSSSVGNTSAVFNGTANANRAATTGYFRYAATDPVTCNDTFGSRAPVTGGSNIGSGASALAYAQSVNVLSAGTTYYFCAIATNAEGLSFGAVLSFTTPAVPTAASAAATLITTNGATLNGSGDPNLSDANGVFRYSTSNPGTCNSTFGTVTASTYLGVGTDSVSYSRAITGLTAATTYYFCAVVDNGYGTAYGAVLSFTTLSTAPTASTGSVSPLSSTTATLNGSANPGGDTTTGWFRYSTISPGTCNDSFGLRAPTAGGSNVGSAITSAAYSQATTGLSPLTTYYYCAITQNSNGTALGSLLSFITPAPPTVTTVAATSVSAISAVLNGSGNPNRSTTSGWFRYASTDPGTCNDTFGSRAPVTGFSNLGSGAVVVNFAQTISTLSAGTTYYYCALDSSAEGSASGAVMSFTTQAAPTVVTSPATLVTATTATLNGAGDPNGADTYGWYRYATTNPGVCNDSFGTLATSTYLGAATDSVPFPRPITGLTPATTYYFCAIANNVVGTSVGSVLTFTTPPANPVITTVTATVTSTTAAALNGSGNPNGAATTGWFRMDTVNPVNCDDTFGTRVPTSGGSALGAGVSAVSFSQNVVLVPGTTYYFCAIGESSLAKVYGSVRSFVMPKAPTVATLAATPVTSTTATLNGTVNSNSYATTAWFRYSAADPGVCNDTFGTRMPGSGGTSISASTSTVSISQSLTSLSPGTTYYFCALAQSSMGTTLGELLSFTTPPTAPTVTTFATTSIGLTTGTLQGAANPNGADATAWFRYATTNPITCNDTFGTRAPLVASTALGLGNTSVPYAEPLTGLTLGVTYYVCAVAQNSVGKGYGAVVSFTTTAAPTVTTTAAMSVINTSATINASVNPNATATTGWFRYATTSPGTCNDTFGTRTPTPTGTALGSGSVAVPLSATLTGLTGGITYYYCAIASNGSGTAFGAVLSFTTLDSPTVTTQAATLVTGTGVTLPGTANPNQSATTGWFRYSTTNPVTCSDAFGTRAPAAGGTNLGSGATSVAFSEAVTGLATGTTYYYCALASNTVGVRTGAVLSFTTQAAPTVTTVAASGVSGTAATLNANANPRSSTAHGWFRYSATNPTACDDTFGTRAPATGDTSLGAGASAVNYFESLTGLSSGTTYYFCAVASNDVGKAYGTLLTFTTPGAPSVTTVAATSVGLTSGTLQGTATANLSATSAWFRYSTTDPVVCSDSFGTRTPSTGGTSIGSGTTAVPFSSGLTGLAQTTTYYYCAIAQNPEGTSVGAVMSFTTPTAPSVTTLTPTLVASTTATLEGTADPKGAAGTGWFRYSTTNPGTCNDSFGTRTPVTVGTGTSLGSGTGAVAYEAALTGLTSGATYYTCAIASNPAGTAFGSVVSFTTLAAPTVVTQTVASITGTTASLNGTATANLAATTGWFRYSTTSPGTCNDTFGTRAPTTGGTDLGSGSTSTPFTEAITGLATGTTYYVCAVASNSVGTRFGSVVSFTTLAGPTVTTNAASVVTGTGFTLNGLANPRSTPGHGWFRYDTTNPGTCNDTFGNRAPLTGDTALGSGAAGVTYTQILTGLTSGTTYYFCAIASNDVATAFGAVLSVVTPGAPSVTTLAATSVGTASVTLQGSANPNYGTTSAWFRYDTVDPGNCNDSFGFRTPSVGGAALGAGSAPVTFSNPMTGLFTATTYYYCAIAQNGEGTRFGAVLSFNTTSAPNMVTLAASSVASTTATFEGTADPNFAATTAWFRYATTSPVGCNDTFGTRAPSSGGTSIGSGNAPVTYSQAVTGLTPATTYYVCAIGQNTNGTVFGSLLTFTTPAAPAVTTLAASSVTGTGATLNGTANPRSSDAHGWFRYSTTSPGTCNDTFGTRAPAVGDTALGAGAAAVPFDEVVTGLTPGSTVYFCAIASNTTGTAFGAVLSLTTLGPPTVVTLAPTPIGSTTATLQGSVNPNQASATVWFRYDTVSPGTCNDSFGTRGPSVGGTVVGSGSTVVPITQAVTGLTANTTYHVCAIGQNSEGTSFGAVVTFSTTAAPTVVTNTVSGVTTTAAVFNGTGTANGAAATGWFRYSITNPVTCNDTFGTRAPASLGASLGSGSTPTPYTQSVTGLTQGTTYYVCAIASNAVGTSVGQVVTFSTLGAPIVTTDSATSSSATDATLFGLANPNQLAATGWFRYATTRPASCNDTFGTRAPSSGGTSLGSGAAAVNYQNTITGLAASTTYYYCAIASNSAGTGLGGILQFTTSAGPSVTTVAASLITDTSATINGSANPKSLQSTGWLRYASINPGSCNDSFGTRAPAAGGTGLGAGAAAVPYGEALIGLTPGATYYYCALASNSAGAGTGSVLSFTTARSPVVTTVSAIGTSPSTGTLSGLAAPNGLSSTGWFRYDTVNPGACDDTFGTRAPVSGGTALGSGPGSASFTENLTGLASATTYYACAIASNSAGTSYGALLSFTTTAPPLVVTHAASGITGTTATLEGSANPLGLDADGWFRYDTVDPGSCNDTFGTRAPPNFQVYLGNGAVLVDYSYPLTGLAPATTYYVCAIASNLEGTAFGGVVSFTSAGFAPSVVTDAPTLVTPNSAVLNGSGVPNGGAATAWFRYATSSPGSCNDTFGTRAPSAGGSDLGSGSAVVPFSESITGLTPGVVIYYCAIASNPMGTVYGDVESFTPGAFGPEVVTEVAAGVTSTTATLVGTANPVGSDGTGWFRYGDYDPGSCDETFGSRAPESGGASLGAGTDPVGFEQAVADLSPNTTYFYCAAADNQGGASFGAVLSFTTSPLPPTVQTIAATVSDTDVTLNGASNPNGSETVGWFRYTTQKPEKCDDTFGTRMPSADGTNLGSLNSEKPFSEELTALAPGTYYYCAIAASDAGTAFGEFEKFEVGGDDGKSPKCGCASGDPTPSALPVAALVALGLLRRRRAASARAA